MNIIYKKGILIGLLGFGILSTNMYAQAVKDTTLNRQVNLEREYTPIIQDASKINTVPARHITEQTQHALKFENTAPTLKLSSYPIADTGSGDINTKINFDKHRGYLSFGGGMYLNLEGTLGYRIVDSTNDQFDLFATHNSTNDKIKYMEGSDKVKAKNMENFVKAKFSHKFAPLTWSLAASFLNNGYNYYGNPYLFPMIGGDPDYTENLEKNQSANIFEVETGVTSAKYSDVEYGISLKYNNFSSKYGPDINFDGISANLFDANVHLALPFDSDKKIGIKGGILYQNISDPKFIHTEDAFHNLTVLRANPYFNIDGGDIYLTLGANLNYALDKKNKMVIAPTIKAAWHFEDKSSLYLNIDGGINDNNVVSIFKENRYVNTDSRIAYSQTLYDAQLGIKSGVIEGFEFDIFGGYKYTKDEHLYYPTHNTSWYNVSAPMYANLGTGNFGGLLKTKFIPYTDLSVKAATYFYNLKKYTSTDFSPEEKKAWGLPSFTIDLNADLSIIENLILSLNYSFEGGRKSYVNSSSVNMKNINELTIKGSYNIANRISLYARINNLLNQKYERYYGYTLQGISTLAGVSLTF